MSGARLMIMRFPCLKPLYPLTHPLEHQSMVCTSRMLRAIRTDHIKCGHGDWHRRPALAAPLVPDCPRISDPDDGRGRVPADASQGPGRPGDRTTAAAARRSGEVV